MATLEAGLAQRARLLDLILTDLYGPQRLLRDGLLPPALVFANPAFLRPCHGIRVPRDIYLHLLRRRSRALAGRPLVGARRSHAGAVGHRLRAGESHRAVAHVAGGISRLPGAAARRVLSRAARHAARARAAQPR